METIALKADIGQDHVLQVKLPDSIPPGSHEVIVVIDAQPVVRHQTDIMQYSGKITSWPEDALAYQQQLRDEWD